jgi:hypothetical protein
VRHILRNRLTLSGAYLGQRYDSSAPFINLKGHINNPFINQSDAGRRFRSQVEAPTTLPTATAARATTRTLQIATKHTAKSKHEVFFDGDSSASLDKMKSEASCVKPLSRKKSMSNGETGKRELSKSKSKRNTKNHTDDADDSPLGTETPKKALTEYKSTRSISARTETAECTRDQKTKPDDAPNEQRKGKRASVKKNIEAEGGSDKHKNKSTKKMDTEKELNCSDTPKPKRRSIKMTADAAEESDCKGGNDAPKIRRKSIQKKAGDIDDLESKVKKVQLSAESEAVNERQEHKLKRKSSKKSLQTGVGSEVVDGTNESKIKQKSSKKKQEPETEIGERDIDAQKLKRESSKKKLLEEDESKAVHDNDGPKLKRKSSSKKKLGEGEESKVAHENKVAAKESNRTENSKKSSKETGSKLTPPKRILSTGVKSGKISEDSRVVNHLYDDNIFDSAKMFLRRKLGKS